MNTRALLVGFGFVLGLSRPALATTISTPPAACTTGSLASYIAANLNPIPGCNIAVGHTDVVFFDFSFSVLSTGGGAIPIDAASITVTPSALGLTFSSPGFSVSGAESVTYLLSYTVDPHPILNFFRVSLATQTPVFPGLASITSDLCIGAPFAPACSGTPASVSAFHNGTTSSVSNSLSFGAVSVLGVMNTITLEANGASADFSSFDNVLQEVPEPATVLVMGSGLLGLGLSRRRRSFR